MKNETRIKLFIIILIITMLGIYTYTKFNNHEVDNNYQEEIKLPTFSDYPVELFNNSSISIPLINLDSHSTGSQFKTRISEANKTDPDFAGKYSIVMWGCGTGCQAGVIVDRSTGNIIDKIPFGMENGYEAKIDSSLIIINPYNSDLEEMQQQYPVTTYYAKWNGKTFDVIGSYIITKNSIKISTSTPSDQLK